MYVTRIEYQTLLCSLKKKIGLQNWKQIYCYTKTISNLKARQIKFVKNVYISVAARG